MTTKRSAAKNRIRKAAGHAVDKIVGARLAEKRKAAGMTPIAVGKVMGRSETQIYRYESGATRTDTPLLAEFAKLYGCKVEDFVTGIE
jgi:transcriptional regulator with XRE-family HTH domain